VKENGLSRWQVAHSCRYPMWCGHCPASHVGRGWPRGIQQFFGSRWTKFIFRNHGWTLFLSGALIALGLYGMTGACLSRRSLALQKHIRSGRLSLKHISVFSWHFGKHLCAECSICDQCGRRQYKHAPHIYPGPNEEIVGTQY
jgi:hypothetical protein